jgi:TonB-dependent heme/hemoglobin receptor
MAAHSRKRFGALRRFAPPVLCGTVISVCVTQGLAQVAQPATEATPPSTPPSAVEAAPLPEIEVNPTRNRRSRRSRQGAAPAPRAVVPANQTAPVPPSPGENKGFQGTPNWVYTTPGGVSVISREVIEQRSPRNTSDLFQDMSGVFTPSDRQNPGMTVNIRGLQEQGRVNVMIDGARQNFQQAGHDAVNFVYADPELIGGVVVEKGPTSTVGGAGVIGGVVSMRTLEADDILLPGRNYGVRSRIGTGTNQYTLTTSHAGATRNETFESVAAVSRKELGAYKPGQNGTLEFVGPGQPVVFTGQNSWSGLTKFKFTPTPDQTLKVGYVGLNNAFSTGDGEFTDTNKLFTQTATADYSWKPNSWVDFKAKAWWSDTDNHQYRPPRTTYGYFDLRYGLTSFGGSLMNTSKFDIPMFNVEWTYGAEYFKDQTKTGVITDQTNPADAEWFSGPTPAGTRDIASPFTEIKFKQGEWLELIAGGRYDQYSLKGSGNFYLLDQNFDPATRPFAVDKSDGRFSPSFTVAVTPSKGFQIYGKYMEGYRPPQIMETLQYGRHIGNGIIFGPNPNLLPETSKTLEAGANFKYDNVLLKGDAFRAKVAYYETTVDNFITTAIGQYPQAGSYPDVGLQTPFVRVNLLGPTTVMKGLEMEASYDVGDAYIGGSYTHLKATYDGVFNPFFAGPPDGDAYLPFLPEWERQIYFVFVPPEEKFTVDGGLRFIDRKITVGGRVTHVGPTIPLTSAQLLETYKLKSYTLYGLYLAAAFNENVTARVNVDNLFDVAYVDAMGVPTYPAPGRTITFSVQAKF